MDLTLSGEFAKRLLTMTKKDTTLAIALAQEFLSNIDHASLAEYLLTEKVALALLADRIRQNPEETLKELQHLPNEAKTLRRGRQRGRIAGSPGHAKAIAPSKGRGKRKRQRFTSLQVVQIKNQVRAFLNRHPWSTRKEILHAVKIPSVAGYNRIMSELRDSGDVTSQGEKSKTVYALKGAKSKGKMASKPIVKRIKKAGAPPKKKAGKPSKAPVAKKTAVKAVKKASSKPRAPLFCPVPGCTNKAAPVFGMMCKEHKDLPKSERDKYFADRRAAQKPTP